MNIGQLRHKVTFQRATTTQNTLGEPVQAWANIVQTKARVEALAGKERFSAMQQQAESDHRVVCRYQSAIASLRPSDRIIWGSQVFDIKSVINPDWKNIELHSFVRLHIGVTASSEVPANALTDVDGNPLMDVDGNYIETVD